MKLIRIKYVDFPYASFDPEDHWITQTLKKRYRIEFSDTPDFLFYSTWGCEFLKYPNAVRIFFTGEPVSPNFNDCDYALVPEPIHYNDRCCQFPIGDNENQGLYHVASLIQDRSRVTADMADRKFCNFVASHDWVGQGGPLRRDFCKALMERYKHVDCPSHVLHNLDSALMPRWSQGLALGQGIVNKDWHQTKIDFIRDYKFTIAFENCAMSGNTTEKISDAFLAYSVPIYWGNPDILEIANPKAFINCNGYENDFDAIIAEIKRLDNDRDAYLEMLSQPPLRSDFDFDRIKKAEAFLYRIIEKGNNPFEKDAHHIARSSIAYDMMSANERYAPPSLNETFIEHCRSGRAGLKTILKALKGWLAFKLRRRK